MTLDEAGVEIAGREGRMGGHRARNSTLVVTPTTWYRRQGGAETAHRPGAGRIPDDQLGDHRVIVDGDCPRRTPVSMRTWAFSPGERRWARSPVAGRKSRAGSSA